MKIDGVALRPSVYYEPRQEHVHIPNTMPRQDALLVLDCQEPFWIFCLQCICRRIAASPAPMSATSRFAPSTTATSGSSNKSRDCASKVMKRDVR